MDDLVRSTKALESVSTRPTLLVKGSIGQGNWAAIPWLALLDRRITTSTTHGFYVVFLFRSDMQGVYLTLNQGVTRFRERSAERGNPRALMAASARDYAGKLEASKTAGFTTEARPDLKSPTSLGTDYEYAAIAHKFYALERLPSEEQLLADLEAVLRDYERLVDQETALEHSRAIVEQQPVHETSLWDQFAYWAGLELSRSDFDEEERLYKLVIAERLAAARTKLLAADPDWVRALRRAFAQPNNLTTWQVHAAFLDWCDRDSETARRALEALWDASIEEPARIRGFIAGIPDEVKSARRQVIFAFLLMAMGPEEHPPYRTTPFEKGYELTGYPPPASGLDRASEYDYSLGFLDAIQTECRSRGVQMRDRLDAQSVLWAITKNPPAVEWDAETSKRFLAYRGEQLLEDEMTNAQAIYDRLCSPECEIRFPEWVVSDYLLSLAAKPFVLLSGISGTGKTKIAQIVSEMLAGEDEVLEAEPVKRDDPNAAYHTVGKSTLAYGLVVPREKDFLFMDVQPGPSTEVTVRTDSGEFNALLGRVAFSGDRQPVMRLMWRKSSLEWIQATAQLGDVLEIRPAADDPLVIDVRVLKPHRSASKTNARRIALVPVRADWTDNRDLLGFYNVLTERYEPTDLLRVLLRAVEEPEKLHFVILDEMNLAKVEYYFADFLSAMETKEYGSGIPLHDQDDDVVIDLDGDDRVVPKRLPLPANVFFTGTVNIDETTHMFSRKVLDRANVIEFHDVDAKRHMGLSSAARWSPSLRLRPETDVARMLTLERDRPTERAALAGKLAQRVAAIHDILAEYNLHFGYRVIDECARFLWLTRAYAGAEYLDGALDLQVLQKVLPKLAGNRSELQEPLERLLSYFTTGEDRVLDLGDTKSIRDYDLSGALMPLSAAKIRRMLERLTAVGFTSFVE